jgi:hypothetical protein
MNATLPLRAAVGTFLKVAPQAARVFEVWSLNCPATLIR